MTLSYHDDRIAGLVDRLQGMDSAMETESPLPKQLTDHSQPLQNKLHPIERKVGTVQEILEPLAGGPNLDHCLLQQLDEQIVGLKVEWTDVVKGIAMPKDEQLDLLDPEATLDKALFDLGLQIKWLLYD